ncbi:twin-arginine translocation signal domain-containing protein, partial [Rhodoferax sp. OV413]|uniref:twin-arginine translocation signal domain-containing protein n=1 Tax=Rhodoferax sp. OV413 TaxID=1855285 RepID=UPI0025F02407
MRVISIAPESPEVAGCDEDSGVVRKVNLPLARRDFLKGSGLLFGTLATGTLLAGLAPSNA